MIDPNFIEMVNKINSMVSVEQVMEYLEQDVKKETSDQLVYSCLWHSDSSPSFMVNKPRNVFHCLGCRKSGSTYGLVKEHLKATTLHDTKISFKSIQDFLSNINPEILNVQWKVYRPIDINPNKKNDFKTLLSITNLDKQIKIKTLDEKRLYITGIMHGFDNETLETFIKFKVGKNENKELDLFSKLLGSD